MSNFEAIFYVPALTVRTRLKKKGFCVGFKVFRGFSSLTTTHVLSLRVIDFLLDSNTRRPVLVSPVPTLPGTDLHAFATLIVIQCRYVIIDKPVVAQLANKYYTNVRGSLRNSPESEIRLYHEPHEFCPQFYILF